MNMLEGFWSEGLRDPWQAGRQAGKKTREREREETDMDTLKSKGPWRMKKHTNATCLRVCVRVRTRTCLQTYHNIT